ncbi:MAG: ABC transporter ATP-binding protein [Bacteroidales bacterium]|nr:ABC transporter ATP-binding protein [Bacteroidales bacterium]
MSNILLDIKNLSIASGKQVLVDNVSLQISKNKVLGLVGESGSGKTLTALSVTGLLQHGLRITSGTILFHAADNITDLAAAPARIVNRIRGNKISMIFQEPMTSLNPSMKCGAQAMEPLLIHRSISKKDAKKKTLNLFNDVKLPDADRIFNAWPHELSGGQRQRVMIAMALSTSPDLLIADEPTTALDVTVQKSILELLAELQEKYKLSILFVSHDLMVINQVADHIAVMHRGKIVEHGTRDQVSQYPTSDYTRGLMACKPGLNDRPYRLTTISDFLSGSPPAGEYPERKEKKVAEEAILTVKELDVTFGKKNKKSHAVRSVSFDLFRGETLGLVGESGCGKTTLGRAILQLVEAENGSIVYKGIPLDQIGPSKLRKIRRNIQIVFQDPYSTLNPGMTVRSILSEPLIIHNLVQGRRNIYRKVESLLEQVGLSREAMDYYPHQFSGGQRQRIGIARALACQPEFIILDESVSALDVSIQAQILNLLNDLKDTYDLTYIFISHDLTVVKYMSDRVLVMNEGRIIEWGTSDQIYRYPKEPFTRKLINSIPS